MLEPLHPLSPIFSILTVGPDPEAIEATHAKFPEISVNFGSGPYAKAEMDFPKEIFLVMFRNLVRDVFIFYGERCCVLFVIIM